MGNYHYIIAGLPDLILDFESSGYDFDALFQHIQEMSTTEDRRCMEWLFFGLKEENLNNHFYRAAKKSKTKFIREYFKFDLQLRNIQAAYIARKNSLDPSVYLIGENEITDQLKYSKAADFGLSLYSDSAPVIIKALETENILDREQMLDNLRWNKANEICTFNYFDINVILSFLLKAAIVKRWNKLDRKKGALIFK
ncbi:MAG: DUF2764 family protein, partial [Bacteroidia bacterium]|nr:DUF2764 family protein [Bacteroidia bacterium]